MTTTVRHEILHPRTRFFVNKSSELLFNVDSKSNLPPVFDAVEEG